MKVAFNPLPFYVFLSVTLTHTPQIDHYNDRISPFCLCVCVWGGAFAFFLSHSTFKSHKEFAHVPRQVKRRAERGAAKEV